MKHLKRLLRAIIAWLNAPVAEIDGCRNCRWAWFRNDGTGTCNSPRKSRAGEAAKGWITEIMPYRADECEAWARKEGETNG